MSETGIRLNKYLAERGIASRREADKIIEAGRVTVNGQPASAGMKVNETDEVCLDGTALDKKEDKKVVLAYYKPVGVTCSSKDEHADSLITDRVNIGVRLTYAGRLDRESEGLILLTNDGDLIHEMMTGSKGHEKEYLVVVQREPDEEFLNAMSKGVYLEDLGETTRPCRVKRGKGNTFTITLTQGLNRQIRRMCSALHYHVNAIKRVRVLNINLRDLRPDEYREITGQELRELYKSVGLKRK